MILLHSSLVYHPVFRIVRVDYAENMWKENMPGVKRRRYSIILATVGFAAYSYSLKDLRREHGSRVKKLSILDSFGLDRLLSLKHVNIGFEKTVSSRC